MTSWKQAVHRVAMAEAGEVDIYRWSRVEIQNMGLMRLFLWLKFYYRQQCQKHQVQIQFVMLQCCRNTPCNILGMSMRFILKGKLGKKNLLAQSFYRP